MRTKHPTDKKYDIRTEHTTLQLTVPVPDYVPAIALGHPSYNQISTISTTTYIMYVCCSLLLSYL